MGREQMKRELLTVREFAELAKVSKQSVYKRISQMNNAIIPYVEVIDRQKMIDSIALWKIYGVEIEEGNHFRDQLKNNTEKVILDMLQKELDEKNKQIERLQNQLEQAQKIIDQEQQLRMVFEHKALPVLQQNQDNECHVDEDELKGRSRARKKKAGWLF